MLNKVTIALCLFFLIALHDVDAQRTARRRTGRRKPTTESPVSPTDTAMEEAEMKNTDPKPDAVADIPKLSSAAPVPDTENGVTPSEKDSDSKQNARGRQFLSPRGTRKPRPTATRGSSERKPKPTLPTFVRKSSGRRINMAEKKKVEEQQPASPPSSTAKPSRGSSRFRGSSSSTNNNNNNPTNNAAATESPDSAQSTSTPRNKRRFGSTSPKRSFRGSRRTTTEATEY